MNSVETLTIDEHGVSKVKRYQEFDPDSDGQILAEAMLEKYGTKEACIKEMHYMTIIAAAKNDLTTLNGLACVRAYWRAEAVK